MVKKMLAAALLLFAGQASATPMLCSQYVNEMGEAIAKGTSLEALKKQPFLFSNVLAYGAYARETGKKYSELSNDEQQSIGSALYTQCMDRSSEPLWDVAVTLNFQREEPKPVQIAQSPSQEYTTMTGRQIAAGVSSDKTEMEQEQWWKDNIKGRNLSITGKVSDVEEGTFSGYWVTLDIGRNVDLRCGLGDRWKSTAQKLRKGVEFTCKGKGGNTWTSFFGILFQMDADDPTS